MKDSLKWNWFYSEMRYGGSLSKKRVGQKILKINKLDNFKQIQKIGT